MTNPGIILQGDEAAIKASYEEMNHLPVDWDLSDTTADMVAEFKETYGLED